MKRNINHILAGVVGAALSAGLWSCTSEAPFDTEGTGVVHLHTTVNSITTRAYTYDPDKTLEENCVIYISRNNGNDKDGLIHKWTGTANIPSSISLNSGHYVAEAWSGDSTAASFTSKFFRGAAEFDIAKGDNKSIEINCKIRNVVASVNALTENDLKIMNDDYTVTIRNSKGELIFTKDNSEERGYFMMPTGESTLEYTITGTYASGTSYTKEGTVEDVLPAHQYNLTFVCDPNEKDDTEGGALIQIEIKDEELISDNVTVATRPAISGLEFDIDRQQVYVNDEDIPEEMSVRLCAFGDGFKDVHIMSASATQMGIPSEQINLVQATANYINQYKDAGIELTAHSYSEKSNVSTAFLKLSRTAVLNLAKQDTEHVISITATDKQNLTTTVDLHIARTEAAIKVEDPIIVSPIDTERNPMAVMARSATVSYQLSDSYEGTPGIEYRKESDTDWTFVAAATTRAAAHTITITGLTPGTTYAYRAACGEFKGEELHFTTETPFSITNSSMEDWSTYQASTLLGTKTVTLPGSSGDKTTSFWGSGNEGSATANMTLTDKSTDMVHSGTYSARLESKSALGVIAAGNLFVGYYVKTDGTNGVLSLGRPFNGTHPEKLKVYANYRPASGVKSSDKIDNAVKPSDFTDGGYDHGQIYIALTTQEYEIRTKPADRQLLSKDDPCVIAYGQVTWSGDFGPDGSLQEVEIPIEYNSRANTTRPTHIIIVCSASKYGDYFSGASGSTMYVDDFELVY